MLNNVYFIICYFRADLHVLLCYNHAEICSFPQGTIYPSRLLVTPYARPRFSCVVTFPPDTIPF